MSYIYVAVHNKRRLKMQQQNPFTESMGEFCQCMTKPMADLTRLNIETFNHLAKNSDCIDSFMQAKKPEDILSAQIKFVNAASLEAFKYMQTASAILMEAATQNGRMFTEMAKESMKTQEMGKSRKK